MIIRIYYEEKYGTVKGVVIEGKGQWNILELNDGNSDSYAQIEFELTEENLERYMDHPHGVDLEEIAIEEIENHNIMGG